MNNNFDKTYQITPEELKGKYWEHFHTMKLQTLLDEKLSTTSVWAPVVKGKGLEGGCTNMISVLKTTIH